MATDKRAMRLPGDNKYYDNSSLSYQTATTSANDDNNNNNIRNIANQNNENHRIDLNNNRNQRNNIVHNNYRRHDYLIAGINKQDRSVAGHLSDHCHHQAATSFLFNHHNHQRLDLSNLTEPSTIESEESVTPPPHYHEIPGIVPAYQGRTSGPPPAYDEVMNPNAPPPSYQSLYGQVREARKTSNGFVDLFRQLFLILIGTIGCTMIIGFLLLIPITMILVGFFYVNECRAENIPTFLIIGGIVWIVKNILNCYNQFKKDSSTANRPPPRRAPLSTNLESAATATTMAATSSSSASVLIASSNGHSTSSGSTASTHSNESSSNSSANSTATTTITSSSTTRMRNAATRDIHEVNHIRQPPMIGLTSYKCESILNYFLIVWFLAGCIVVYRIYEPDYENPSSATYCNRIVYLYAFWLMTSAFIIMAIILSCLCCLMASSLMSCNHGR